MIRRNELHTKSHLPSSGDNSEVRRIHFEGTRGLHPESDQHPTFWDESVNYLFHSSKDTPLLQHEQADAAILVRAQEKYSVVFGFSEHQTTCAAHLKTLLRVTVLKSGNMQL